MKRNVITIKKKGKVCKINLFTDHGPGVMRTIPNVDAKKRVLANSTPVYGYWIKTSTPDILSYVLLVRTDYKTEQSKKLTAEVLLTLMNGLLEECGKRTRATVISEVLKISGLGEDEN